MSGVKRFYEIVKPRYLVLFIVNLLAFTQGILMYDATEFLVSRRIYIMENEYENMWNLMGKALLDIMGVVLFGYLAHSFGRKKSIISLGIISLLFQIIRLAILPEDFTKYINHYGHPYYYYVIARNLVNSAPLVISTIYIGEIAEDCNRGKFVSSYILSNRLGQFIYCALKFLDFLNYFGLANILLSVVFVAAAFWLPETPIYLLLNNRTEDAKKALSHLQGNSNVNEGELQDLIVAVEKSNSSNRTIMSFITNPATRKALLIGSFTLILNGLLCTVLTLETERSLNVFVANNPELYLYTFLLQAVSTALLVKICGVIVIVLLVDRCGRKFLLLISCAGVAYFSVFLDIFWIFELLFTDENWIENDFPWLNLTIFILLFLLYDLGCGTVPYILLSELFQTQARVSGITFCYLFYCLLHYLLYIICPLLLKLLLDFGSSFITFFVFITISFCGYLFTYYCIPETKGKSLKDIAEMLKRQE